MVVFGIESLEDNKYNFCESYLNHFTLWKRRKSDRSLKEYIDGFCEI
jgi:hypothetical protein